jgi:hypothetical protein
MRRTLSIYPVLPQLLRVGIVLDQTKKADRRVRSWFARSSWLRIKRVKACSGTSSFSSISHGAFIARVYWLIGPLFRAGRTGCDVVNDDPVTGRS